MRLKSLELFGFKSFPQRTKMEFADGINTVVGPNGCGKSNVVDAIRWVLGETSARSLRGTTMGDLIFNGSSKTGPMSLAEVVITFDNSDRTLNLDYDEVAISRRLYRSGESDFRINGKRVRMRDVHDLLADTGIGRAAYAIIEQGMIDRIVEAKPQQRREIFEEAAGVRRYRRRREEALSKLEAVHKNLERVEDLLNEYQSRSRSLKRQAGIARRYNEHFDNRKKLDIGLAFIDWKTHQSKKTEITEKLNRTRTALDEAYHRVTSAESSYAAIGAELQNARLKQQDFDENRYDLQGKLSSAQSDLSLVKERLSTAQNALLRNEEEITRRQRTDEQLTESIKTGEEKENNADEELKRLQGEVNIVNAEKNEFENKINELNESYKEARNQLIQSINDINQENDKRTRLDAMLIALEKDLLRLGGEQSKTELLFGKLSEDKDSLMAQTESHQIKLAEVKTEYEHLSEKHSVVDKTVSDTEQELATVKGELGSQNSRLKTLRELSDRLESYESGARDLVQNRSDLILGTLAESLNIEEGYELAVERTLGAGATALLTQNTDAAAKCVEVLREQDSGRASFILGTGGSQNNASLPDDDGVIGYLTKYISTDTKQAQAIYDLIGNTIIVENLDVLIRLSTKINNPLVTPQGDYWNGRGLLSGGSPGDPGTSIVGRRSECLRLENSVKKLDKQLSILEESLSQNKAERTELAVKRESLSKEETRLNTSIQSLQKETAALLNRSETVTQEQSVISEEAARTKSEITKLKIDVDAVNELISELTVKRDDVESNNIALEKEVEKTQQELNFVAEKASAINTNTASLVSNLNAIKQENERLRNQSASNLRRIEQTTDEESKTKISIIELRDELSTVALSAAELKSASEDIDGVFAGQKLIVAEIEARLNDTQTTKKQREEEHFNLRDSVGSLEIEDTRIVGDISAIDERIYATYKKRLRDFKAAEFDLEISASEAREQIEELNRKIERMGQVNFLAAEEYDQIMNKLEHIEEQKQDLVDAEKNLTDSIFKIDEKSREQFLEVFEQARLRFIERFKEVFDGGKADIVLEGDRDPLEAGVIIYAEPPGKKMEMLTLLSGGEKAMTAIALIFSLIDIRPAPFCVLDEVDAPLDDNNVLRFLKLVRGNLDKTQFLLVTHVKKTMEAADVIYGITMEQEGVSRMLSLNLDDIPEQYIEPN